MIEFRHFRNTDPPGLVRVWNTQPTQRGLLSAVSEPLLDQYVLSKLFFDPHGLIVAQDGDTIRGFVHAGFGPGDDGQQLDCQQGAIALVMVDDHSSGGLLGDELRQCAEEYLRQQGTRNCWGGAWGNVAPFYRGLYGGSSLPGILESDQFQTRLFQAAGYLPQRRNLVWQRTLVDFRPPMSRELLQVRRQCRVESVPALPPTRWWEACCSVHHEDVQFRLTDMTGSRELACMMAWDLEPLSSSWGTVAAGLLKWQALDPQVSSAHEQFLLVESLKQLQTQGISLVETQIAEEDVSARALLEELGFRQVDVGVVYHHPQWDAVQES
jgi:hypothetical protein